MNNKIEKLSFLIISFVILFSANLVFANPIALPGSYFSMSHEEAGRLDPSLFIKIAIIVISLGAEVLFGYLLFFKNNKRGIVSLVYANLISYPLFYLYTAGLNLLSVAEGEIFVVAIEAIFIKLWLKDNVTFKKALLI
ncbi:MAG: hypothetical protein COX29_03850 [Candidatus Moranbacteria bacterium CG23_combo_of_CG06-09_8_20_14_all_35_22]|nr:MAG: hypothetical protein COX29_03850 [Candidatus Moranbacteria bacterium CG23_combo_of_CG06-09_8_20_14_all_35_22]